MNPVKDVVEGKILSEMKKYRQSNSFAATTTGCDTGDTENTGHPVYEIFCIIKEI